MTALFLLFAYAKGCAVVLRRMSFGFATLVNVPRDTRIALHSRARARFITPESYVPGFYSRTGLSLFTTAKMRCPQGAPLLLPRVRVREKGRARNLEGKIQRDIRETRKMNWNWMRIDSKQRALIISRQSPPPRRARRRGVSYRPRQRRPIASGGNEDDEGRSDVKSPFSFGGRSVGARSRVTQRRWWVEAPRHRERDGGERLRAVRAKTQLRRRTGDIVARIPRGRGTQEEVAGRDRKDRHGNTRAIVSVFATFSAELLRGLDSEGRRDPGRFARGNRGGEPTAATGNAIIPGECASRETGHSKTADSHAVGRGDTGDAADEVRALPEERQLGRDLETAERGEDSLGSGDGGAEGGQRQDQASAGARSPPQDDRSQAGGCAESAYEEGGRRRDCGASSRVSRLVARRSPDFRRDATYEEDTR